MPLKPSTRLGPYEVVALIGSGGMGEVYHARDTRLKRDVAIKVLPSEFSADPDRLRRFEQEARAAAALNHSNILAIHDVGSQDGVTYVVSELLEGQTLREALGRSSLAVRKAVDYAIQVAHGLAAAHEKGIVHRDLKPENVFITADGRAKILDFGLAKLTEGAPAEKGGSMVPTGHMDTTPGTVLGTIGYMSPEQVRGLTVDHRSDIFALGAVLYEMLSGRRAFQRETMADTMTAILKEDPPDLPTTSAERHIPPALARIVDRCLEKGPPARFQSAGDLAFALDGLSSHSEPVPSLASAGSPSRPGTRLAWSLVAILTGSSIGLGLWAYVVSRPVEERAVTATILPPDGWSVIGLNPPTRLAISPDGRLLAFVARGPDLRTQLWVRRIDSPTAQTLGGTEGAFAPFWSVDSRSVGFFADGKLKKIAAAGGPAITLCELPGSLGTVTGGTWNQDDVILFGTSGGGLHRVSASGGAPTVVTKIEGETGDHLLPWFLPDGQRFLYRASSSQTNSQGSEIRIGSLESGEHSTLLKEVSQAMYSQGYLLFTRDSTLMAQEFDVERLKLVGGTVPIAEQVLTGSGGGNSTFSVSTNGVLVYQTRVVRSPSRLAWLGRSGKLLGPIVGEGYYTDVDLSRDDRWAAVTISGESIRSGDIWLVDLVRGLPSRFTFDEAGETTAIWSPDGNRVVFNSAPKGRLDLFEKAASDTGQAQALVVDGRDKYPFSWSDDGRFILYGAVGGSSGQDLWVLPLDGNRKPFTFAPTSFNESEGNFSPDTRWIAYVSNESGRQEVYVAPFPGPGRKWPISTAGAAGYPRWRSDGRELYYIAGDRQLMAVPMNITGAELEVGAAKPLFEIPPLIRRVAVRYPYDVSTDGTRFLVNQSLQGVEADSPLTLVVNWTEGLKKP